MTKLHELAARFGVETHVWTGSHPIKQECFLKPRPDLDIAHELLDKLRGDEYEDDQLRWGGGSYWIAMNRLDVTRGTFIECVIALAERALGEK